MSTPGPYSGQYFGDYFGDYLGADAVVTPGAMVGAAHITFSATGVLTAPGSQPTLPAASGYRVRRGRHAADFRPDWLPDWLPDRLPPTPPPAAPAKRARKRRERDLLILS